MKHGVPEIAVFATPIVLMGKDPFEHPDMFDPQLYTWAKSMLTETEFPALALAGYHQPH